MIFFKIKASGGEGIFPSKQILSFCITKAMDFCFGTLLKCELINFGAQWTWVFTGTTHSNDGAGTSLRLRLIQSAPALLMTWCRCANKPEISTAYIIEYNNGLIHTRLLQMNLLLKEYLISGDEKEADHCLRDLEVPHFHHELVYEVLSTHFLSCAHILAEFKD